MKRWLTHHKLMPGKQRKSQFFFLAGGLISGYLLLCLGLFVQQRRVIYVPEAELALRPDTSEFGLVYQDVWVPIKNSAEQLHGWWLPALPNETISIFSDEPQQVLSEPKTMLYLYGVGPNKGDRHAISRIAAFRQLGFSVLVVDYRGYGESQGNFPTEERLYEDAQAAWDYLLTELQISPEDVVVYGESMGGAIALNLATQQPDAAGLIIQSSFTTMADAVKYKPIGKLLPVKLLLTEKFNSLERIRNLQMPVLLLHGADDKSVPVRMSNELYNAAPEPKRQLIIAGANHNSIYQPGADSYLKAIEAFVSDIDLTGTLE
ncbi:MAG: alpha/beta hydrolase [Cyanobacteria bacterium J06643_4]